MEMEELNKALITNIQNRCGLDKRLITSRCKELLREGADPNYKYFENFGVTRFYETPLSLAAFREIYELCKLLLDYGANINVSSDSRNPLYIASNTGNYELCQLFVDQGADINYLTQHGDTVLEGAMMCGAIHYRDEQILKICKLLIENGHKLVDKDGIKITNKTDRYGFLMKFHADRYNRQLIYEYIDHEVEKYMAYLRRKELLFCYMDLFN